MKVSRLIQLLQVIDKPDLEVVGLYPEHDFPYSIEGVQIKQDRSPDELDHPVVVLTLGDN